MLPTFLLLCFFPIVGQKYIFPIIEGTYAGAPAVQTVLDLNLEKVKLQQDKVTRRGNVLKRKKTLQSWNRQRKQQGSSVPHSSGCHKSYGDHV